MTSKPGKLAVGLIAALALASAGAGNARADRAIAIAPNNVMLDFDTASPATVTSRQITGLGPSESVRGVDLRVENGLVYIASVVDNSANNSVVRTYTLDPGTGAATFVGATAAALAGAGDIPTGYDIRPRGTTASPLTVNRARYVNTNDENARINTDNGALAGNDTDLTPAVTSEIIGVAFDNNTTGETNTEFAINRSTSSLAVIGGLEGSTPPGQNGGVVTDANPLGFTLNAFTDGGLDITAAGVRYAALTDDVDDLTRLYTFNPAGTAVRAGLIADGDVQIFGLTILPTTAAVTPPLVVPDTAAPTVSVTGVAKSVSLKTFLKGLKPTLTPNEPASFDVSLQGTTKRAKLSAFELSLATATLNLAGGARKVTLKPRKKLVGKPRKAVRVRLHIVAADAAGNRRTSDQTITVRPDKKKKKKRR